MTNAAVLIVEDDTPCRESLRDMLIGPDLEIVTAESGGDGLALLDQRAFRLVISDLEMEKREGCAFFRSVRERHPGLPTVLLSERGDIRDVVGVMREGAVDFFAKPVDPDEIRRAVGRYLAPVEDHSTVVAGDPVTQELLGVAERVAGTEATVTLSGESGTGKEVFARFIHERSPRREQPFVAINCAAIPENMLEAVLFGHEKGAFTGATSRHAGKFEQASDGTLLLDEVSEMDIGLQAKLLRVLQERELERIGGKTTIPLNVRVLATTNRDLRQYVAEGKFREDLYYRLNVFPMHIPRLADRPGDILPLAKVALRRYALSPTSAIEFSEDAVRRLHAHNWPGNVRELENLIQRTLILLRGSRIEATDLVFEESPVDGHRPVTADGGQLHCGLRNREHQIIVEALRSANGRRNEVAQLLGISPRTLRYKLARMRAAGVAIPGEELSETPAVAMTGEMK